MKAATFTTHGLYCMYTDAPDSQKHVTRIWQMIGRGRRYSRRGILSSPPNLVAMVTQHVTHYG